MASAIEQLPDTISIGKGMTMKFLRNEAYLTRIHISGALDDETMQVPLHWHEMHDEYFRVLKGKLQVTLQSTTKICTPEDGEQKAPKGTVHALKSFSGVECIFEERTEPMDEDKEIFFRNIYETGTFVRNFFSAMQAFYYGDARPALPGHFWWLERGFVVLVGYYIAPAFGYRMKYDHESLKKLS